MRASLLCAALILTSLVAVGDAHAQPRQQWQGYHWPHRQGGIQAPLQRYDHLTYRGGSQWHYRQPNQGWYWRGYNHHWSSQHR
jgi:hypothetical protein